MFPPFFPPIFIFQELLFFKMAYFRKRSNGWRAEIDITTNEGRFRDSRTYPTKAEAFAWAVRREKEIRQGQTESLDTSKTLKEALERYLAEVTPGKRSEKSEKLRINFFLKCEALNISARLSALSPSVFNNYIEFRLKSVKPATVNKEMSILRGVIKAAIKWRWIEHNPFDGVDKLKEPAPRNRRISDLEISRILDALGYDEHGELDEARKRLGLIFLFAIETGMRLGEICNLDWNNIHLRHRYLKIETSKNGDARDIPLSSRAVELLERIKPYSRSLIHERTIIDECENEFTYTAQPVFFKDFDESSDRTSALFARYIKTTGIKDLRFHDTRHEACTRLARKIDVLDLAKMIGHRDLKSLMFYYNPTATEIADRLG
ncbi:site-specific integrase [Ignatzschineria rhizosphaerae]|uniref:Site-specific integrase n=1 Tax=Ignatzschineria rhizosphaerae TaxID=2923279 RepID=A0ABY3X1L1_9GAMM|nr:site-specific integrase [Ignatzschineria rhizosphaerae]UNM96759.1 site-specific integrase [Ignatzschineria rhizosphaerae]